MMPVPAEVDMVRVAKGLVVAAVMSIATVATSAGAVTGTGVGIKLDTNWAGTGVGIKPNVGWAGTGVGIKPNVGWAGTGVGIKPNRF